MPLRRASVLAALLLLISPGGCCLIPSDTISSYFVDPHISCEELAWRLDLPPLPSLTVPTDVGFVFEEFVVHSANGQVVRGWFVPAQFDQQVDPDPAGTVLILHGTDGSRACAMPWAVAAAINRLNAVVFDYQGYDESGGTADVATLLADSEAVLDWVLADGPPARQRVHLLGVSLGTGPALGLAVRRQSELKSLALDGTFDPLEAAEAVGADPAFAGVFPLIWVSAQFGFPWLFETRDRLGEITLPALFLHAEDDEVTPLSGAQTVAELVGSTNKSFWTFPGRGHAQPLFMDGEEYVSLLVTFWRDPTAEPDRSASETDPTIRLLAEVLPNGHAEPAAEATHLTSGSLAAAGR